MDFTYESYAHWRKEMTEKGGLTLDASYRKDRINALSNDEEASTRALIRAYGSEHRDQMLRWFEQALSEI